MNTKKYETCYIVDPGKTDPEVQAVADHFKDVVVKNGGTVEKAGKWEKRKLAYPIEEYTEGNYVLMNFECDTQVPKELDRLMRISDDVIRHRIFAIDERKVAAEEATTED